jgi:hypothetical protein
MPYQVLTQWLVGLEVLDAKQVWERLWRCGA